METIFELVEATKTGNRDAFAILVSRYERIAVTTAWAVIGDFHLAQDVAQDGFVIAFDKLSTLSNSTSFGPWLLAIVRREAIRISKARQSVTAFDLIGGGEPPPVAHSRYPSQFEMNVKSELVAAISRLPDHEREVVLLFYMEGQSAKEVGLMLDRKTGTVTKQLSRAVGRLRSLMMEFQNESA